MHGFGLYDMDLVNVLYKRSPTTLKCFSLRTTIDGFYSFFGLPFANSSVLSMEGVGMKKARSANLRASSMALFKRLAFASIVEGKDKLHDRQTD